MKIATINNLDPDYSYANALKRIGINSYTPGGNKEAKFDRVFSYIYHEIMTDDQALLIPGLFDFNTTFYVSQLEKTNILAPGAKELVIIGPPYEIKKTGSHVNRLIRSLLNPVGDNFIFTGETNFDISFIAINHNEGKLGAYASLLLTNQLQVLKAIDDKRQIP